MIKIMEYIYTLIGTSKYSKGNMNDAVKWFEKAYRKGRAKPRTVVSYAYVLLKMGNTDTPEEVLNELLGRQLQVEEKMYAKSNLALVLWKKGKLNEAVEMLEEVISSYENTTVYGSLGYMLLLKGDLDKALEFNKKAYEYNSVNTVILDNLGQTYYLRRENDKAREIYEELMLKKPTFPEAYYNYGLVLKESGEKQKALKLVKKSLNYKLSFLSTVTREEIEGAIKELEQQEPLNN